MVSWRVGLDLGGSYAVSRMGERGRAMIMSMELGRVDASPGLVMVLVQGSDLLRMAAVARCYRSVAYQRSCFSRRVLPDPCKMPS